jgi:hypothetical protein
MKYDEVSGSCSTHWDMINAYNVSVRRPKGNRPLGKPRYRWDNIKILLKETGLKMWIGLIWLTILTGPVMTVLFPQKMLNFLTSWTTISFS